MAKLYTYLIFSDKNVFCTWACLYLVLINWEGSNVFFQLSHVSNFDLHPIVLCNITSIMYVWHANKSFLFDLVDLYNSFYTELGWNNGHHGVYWHKHLVWPSTWLLQWSRSIKVIVEAQIATVVMFIICRQSDTSFWMFLSKYYHL